ncbi:very short patch repair endonuclease [Streptomyces sp. NPDC001549]|uniref:very short patch repair endonuclease n=1 Tax=Streptomyces sp. NPDC001549 TaxID=3364586 RepID=UPI0036BC57A3
MDKKEPSEPVPWSPPPGSWASSAANRRSMLGNRSRDTSPERALRSLLHASGLRYRVAAKPLPDMRRTADLVFRPVRVAVFVDGCFWHGCPDHFVAPKTNPEYWREKIGRNMQRDRETDQKLAEAGWLVLRFWEHQAPEECADAVRGAIAARRNAPE